MFDAELLTYLEGFISEERKERFLEVLANRTTFLTVAVEDVFQVHNASAIIRSCDSFGIQEAHIIEDRFEKTLDKNIAMGAEQWVDIYRYPTAQHCIDTLREQGYKIVATTPHGESYVPANFKLDTKTALFFGTEKEGLTQQVLEQADAFLKIPMVGFTESLNVSVSAAILLQQLSDELRKSELSWQLSNTEILDKRLDWTKKTIKDIEGVLSRYSSP